MSRLSDLKNYRSWSIQMKAAFWFVCMSMIQKALSFITVPLFTRVMETEQYGYYSVYLSWVSILTVLLTLNLDSGAYSNILGKEKNETTKHTMTISYITLCFVVTLVSSVFIVIFIRQISAFIGLSYLSIVLMLLEIISLPSIRFWNFQQRFYYRYKILVIYTLASSFLNIGLGIFFVLNTPPKHQAEGRILSIAIVNIIAALVFYFYFVKKAKQIAVIKAWKTTLQFQLPLIPYYLSMNLLMSSDRIMIQRMIGVGEAGIYSVAYSAGQLMTILKQCLMDAVRPWIYEQLNNKRYLMISKLITYMTFGIMLISVTFSAFAPEIIRLMASKEYYNAIYVIPPVAMSSIFTFMYQFFSIIEMYYAKTKHIMRNSLWAAMINIILNTIFIPRFGYLAAGYTTLISYICLCIFHFKTINCMKKELDNQNVFSLKQCLGISFIGIVLSLIMPFFYKTFIWRYLLIVLIGLLSAFVIKKTIIIKNED